MNGKAVQIVLLSFFFVGCYAVNGNDRILLSGNELVPDCWKATEKFLQHNNEKTKLYIAFVNRNINWLHETLLSVSDPYSPNYGMYPTSNEVEQKTAPSDEMLRKVLKWLQSVNVIPSDDDIQQAKHTGYLVTICTIEQAEELLACSYKQFEHFLTKQTVMRALRYSIPSNLKETIAFVGGVDNFPPVELLRSKKSRDTPPESSIVNPAAIRNHYNIPDTLMGQSSQNSHSVAEFDNQWYDPEDLSLFFQRNSLPDTPVTKVVGFNNGTTGADGGEADLDIQYLMGVGVNIPTWFISLDRTFGDGFLEWIILLLGLGDQAPLLQSTSYGADERFLSSSYLDRVSEDLMKFGTTGHTLFYSSGDFGVGCDCSRPELPKYVAHFPASSPYVTSIGGTISLPTVNGTEVGVTFSGGGFSNHFTRQSYQSAAVDAFLNSSTSLPPSSFYNSSNRGYPDMSAWALNYEIYEHGGLDYIGGTSASTPAVAGMFSLINDLRLQQQLPPLGFLNPSLYTMLHTTCYNDITIGNNGDQPCCEGFTAQSGWDPMTGLGSPNFPALQSFFMQSFPLKNK